MQRQYIITQKHVTLYRRVLFKYIFSTIFLCQFFIIININSNTNNMYFRSVFGTVRYKCLNFQEQNVNTNPYKRQTTGNQVLFLSHKNNPLQNVVLWLKLSIETSLLIGWFHISCWPATNQMPQLIQVQSSRQLISMV